LTSPSSLHLVDSFPLLLLLSPSSRLDLSPRPLHSRLHNLACSLSCLERVIPDSVDLVNRINKIKHSNNRLLRQVDCSVILQVDLVLVSVTPFICEREERADFNRLNLEFLAFGATSTPAFGAPAQQPAQNTGFGEFLFPLRRRATR